MREELDDVGTYEWQLGRWAKRQLTREQASEVERLRSELAPWRAVVQMTLELAAELRKGTIALTTTRHGGSSRNASSKSCSMLRTGSCVTPVGVSRCAWKFRVS